MRRYGLVFMITQTQLCCLVFTTFLNKHIDGTRSGRFDFFLACSSFESVFCTPEGVLVITRTLDGSRDLSLEPISWNSLLPLTTINLHLQLRTTQARLVGITKPTPGAGGSRSPMQEDNPQPEMDYQYDNPGPSQTQDDNLPSEMDYQYDNPGPFPIQEDNLPSEMDYQHDKSGPSPDAGSSGFRFRDLPYDIRHQIWLEAMPPTTIQLMCDGGNKQPLRGDARDISHVNREARAIALATHPLWLRDSLLSWVRMDPVHDTLLTSLLRLPPFPHRRSPLRKVVSTFKWPHLYNFHWERFRMRSKIGWFQLYNHPYLHEYTMLCEKAYPILWIPGCQMHDPQPISAPYPARLAIG